MLRSRRLPLATAVALAALPALGLGVLTVYANARHESADTPAASSAEQLPALSSSSLATPLMSLRRGPLALATSHRRDVLAAALQPLIGSLDATSCLAVGTGNDIAARSNATRPVIPASNLKVVVAAAAVEILGADTVFTTKVLGSAPVAGVVQGDVYLVGGGDPVLSEQWYTQPTGIRKRPPLHATPIEALADSLKAAGVSSIAGRVIGDGSRYDDERHPPGWGAAVLATGDGVPVGALVIDDSTDQAGAIAPDPARSAAATFTQLLRARGITVQGDAASGVAPTGAVQLAAESSQALPAMINEMLATSDNLTAEMMVKEIGLTTSGKGTRSDGLKAITDRLVSWGVLTDGLTMVDGSGLSRGSRITCAAMLAVLQRGSATDIVGAGMALADQGGSTLDGRFQQVGLAGVLQAKTGTLAGVKALCGYFPVGGSEVQFVLILNGPSTAAFAGLWSQIGDALLAVTQAPTTDTFAPLPAVPSTKPVATPTGATSPTDPSP